MSESIERAAVVEPPREVYKPSSVRFIKQQAEERRDDPTSCESCTAADLEIIGLCETVEALRSALSAAQRKTENAENFIAALRAPLLYYCGTTDPQLLTEVLADRAHAEDARHAAVSPSPEPGKGRCPEMGQEPHSNS